MAILVSGSPSLEWFHHCDFGLISNKTLLGFNWGAVCLNNDKRQHLPSKNTQQFFTNTCHAHVLLITHKHDGSTVKTIKNRTAGGLVQTSPNLYDCLNWAQLLFVVSHRLPSGYREGDSLSLPIGPVPPPHFLLDLTPRNLPDSNYHGVSCSSGGSGLPPAAPYPCNEPHPLIVPLHQQ